MMKNLQEMLSSSYDRDDFMDVIRDAIKKDGYQHCNEFETWSGDNGCFRIQKNGIRIVDMLTNGYSPNSLALLFDIKAKSLSDIVEKRYILKDDVFFESESMSHIGSIDDVYNHIGEDGCIAKDEDMVILIFDEAEQNYFEDCDNDDTFNEFELLEIYEKYCSFC